MKFWMPEGSDEKQVCVGVYTPTHTCFSEITVFKLLVMQTDNEKIL